jgi:thiol-disulfide isomerase/thioredoxin
MTAGLVACLAALAVATVIGLGWHARNGKMRPARSCPAGSAATSGPPRLTAADLGRTLGSRATLVQFSSAFCAPCRATRVILADVAGRAEGVTHVDIDAESHLDLVRALGVLRTPTVFVLGADGAIAARASGQARRADVLGALAPLLGQSGDFRNSYTSGLETG